MKKVVLFSCAVILILMSFSISIMEKENEVKNENELFVHFLESFEKIDLPFSIGLDDLGGYKIAGINESLKDPFNGKNRHAIVDYSFIPYTSHEYIMESSKCGGGSRMYSFLAYFSRTGGPILMNKYIPVAYYFEKDKEVVAVIYSVILAIGESNDKSFYLANYDLEGNFLGGKINGQQLPYPLKVAYSSIKRSRIFSIDEEGVIRVDTYKNKWEKDVKAKGVIGNKILDYDLLQMNMYQFNHDGYVVEFKECQSLEKPLR